MILLGEFYFSCGENLTKSSRRHLVSIYHSISVENVGAVKKKKKKHAYLLKAVSWVDALVNVI